MNLSGKTVSGIVRISGRDAKVLRHGEILTLVQLPVLFRGDERKVRFGETHGQKEGFVKF